MNFILSIYYFSFNKCLLSTRKKFLKKRDKSRVSKSYEYNSIELKKPSDR